MNNEMASQQKSRKRCLPAWMVAAHSEKVVDPDRGDEGGAGGAKVSKLEADDKDPNNTSKSPSSSASSSASDIISRAMPYLSFPGKVTYCNTFSDCSCFCEELLATLREDKKKIPIGFDMEWPVSYTRGKPDRTALIQMCFSEKQCFLFHISAIGKLPKLLADLISDVHLILVGLNIETDLWKLERDYDLRVKPLIDRGSVVDIGKLANKKLKSSERWDLNGLCKNVLHKRLNKDSAIRCGSWDEIPLSETQKDYAVADAYAGLMLYRILSDETFSKR